MFERGEIRQSLTGAGEIFLDRPDAMRFFDLSVRGFWRSFRAILLVAPLFVLSALAERKLMLEDPQIAAGFSDARLFLDWAVSLGLDWVALPIVLGLLAPRIGLSRTYPAFVIARNWGAVIVSAPFAAIGLLFQLEILPRDVADILTLAAVFVMLRYNYLIARHALETPVATSVAIVVFDFALSLLIGASVNAVLGQ